MRKKISVIIRVYDRVIDLEKNLYIISRLWLLHDYIITVVFNGGSDGYELTDNIRNLSSTILSLEENSGHIKGNSQLIMEALKQSKANTDYTILLEADTWLMGDDLIDKYIRKMNETDYVWASSEWKESRWSLGLDFILINSKFLSDNYTLLFDFEDKAETYVCEQMLHHNFHFIYILELMPVHAPKLIKTLYRGNLDRFMLFPRAKMLTHHIENLDGGMNKKLYLADVCYGKPFFTKNTKTMLKLHNLGYRIFEIIIKLTPRSTWIKKKKYGSIHDV